MVGLWEVSEIQSSIRLSVHAGTLFHAFDIL